MMSIWNRATKSDRLLFVGALVLLILSLLAVGLNDRRAYAARADEEDFLRFVEVAGEIYYEIRGKYVEEVEPRKVLEGALEGMFAQLDEHSQYMDPDTLKSLEKDTSGEFSGIGIRITMRQGILTVIAPIPGSPAAEVGIMPWDRIIEIEGESTKGMTTQDAVKRLTGPAGTKVTFKIYREGEKEPLEFTLRRANVEVESVYWRMLEDKVGYVRLTRFSENTTRDTRRAILELKGDGMKGLIIDLRFNTGGLLNEAIDVANLFTDKGELIVSTKGRLRQNNREFRAMADPIVRNLPLFVLVNEGSASASEIVAGAIQDHGLGVIIGPAGKNTFGKGSVQTIGELNHTLTNDADGNPMTAAIRLTTARYYTPSGRTIHHVGITPDIGVPLSERHQIELMRHGLLGDVFTGEDYRLPSEDEENPFGPQGEQPEGGIQIQNQTPAPDETPKVEEDPSKPFYQVDKPKLLEKDDFVDVLLEEAKKQMKIYMDLNLNGRNGTKAVARTAKAE